MFLKDIFNVITRGRSKPRSRVIYHGVIDSSDNTVVAIGSHASAMVFLSETFMDTIYVPRMGSKDALLPLLDATPEKYPEWSWNFRTRTFSRTNKGLITDGMRARSILAMKKSDVVSYCMYWINRSRDKITSGFSLQETIYATKSQEAQALKDTGFDEQQAGNFPYVAHYAEDNDMSIQQAAEEILLHSKLDREFLEKSERTRLEVFKNIKRATTVEQLDAILSTFWHSGVI